MKQYEDVCRAEMFAGRIAFGQRTCVVESQVSHGQYADRRQTVTLRFHLGAASSSLQTTKYRVRKSNTYKC